MSASHWMSLGACGAILVLAFVVLLRGARNPLGLPIGLLSIDMFVWNFATVAHEITGDAVWSQLDLSFSPFTPPLVLHVVLVFIGQRRTLRWPLVASYLWFGALALVSAIGLFPSAGEPGALQRLHAAIHDPSSGMSPWARGFIAAWLPLLALELGLLIRHMRRTYDLDEQMRSRLMLAAVLVGSLLGGTEFWDEVIGIPPLGHLGALASMLLITIIVFRFKLFGREYPLTVALYAAAMAVLAVFGYLAVLHWLRSNTALLIVGVASLTLALAAASWDVISSLVRNVTQIKTDAALGRIAAQLAHDLKNPLTPLTGGLRFLIKERELGRSIDGQREYLELLLEQAQRITRVLKKYPLLPDVPPQVAPVRLDDVVQLALTTMAPRLEGAGIAVRRELDDTLPACQADKDLIAGAVENVVGNAIHAMRGGGVLTVRTRIDGEPGRRCAVIEIADDGVGMDARQQSLAFNRHHTTRAGGSGLGLDWVRRVMTAHGGEAELSSALGRGTTARLRLPLPAAAAEEQPPHPEPEQQHEPKPGEQQQDPDQPPRTKAREEQQEA